MGHLGQSRGRTASGWRLEGVEMPYRFVRTKEFIAEYLKGNPEKSGMLWIELLSEAINASGAVVVSVGYDTIGEPMTILLQEKEAD